MVLNNCEKRHINLGMVWIHYHKVSCILASFFSTEKLESFLHSCILKSLELVQVPENIMQCIWESMKNWNIELIVYYAATWTTFKPKLKKEKRSTPQKLSHFRKFNFLALKLKYFLYFLKKIFFLYFRK